MNSLMPKKLVIFDMDGLMIDSEGLTFRAFCSVLKEMGYENYSLQVHTKEIIGHNQIAIRSFFSLFYGEDFPYDEFWERAHDIIDGELFSRVEKKEGLDHLIRYLSNDGYKIALATGSDRPRVKTILDRIGLADAFDTCICGNEIQNGKPAPDIFLEACKRLQVKPEESLVLEDSENGILAAHKGDIDVICVPDLKKPDHEYEEMTYAVVPSLMYVIPILESAKLTG